MQLSRQTEIAIGVLISCAKARGRLLNTEGIAQHCKTTKDYTAQVVSQLVRLGWVESYRGRGGGLTLAFGVERLPVGDVLRNFEPRRKERETTSAHLTRILQEAEKTRLAHLDGVTISDLAFTRPTEDCRPAAARPSAPYEHGRSG